MHGYIAQANNHQFKTFTREKIFNNYWFLVLNTYLDNIFLQSKQEPPWQHDDAHAKTSHDFVFSVTRKKLCLTDPATY